MISPQLFIDQLGSLGIDYFAGAVYFTDSYRRQGHNSVLGSFSITWHW